MSGRKKMDNRMNLCSLVIGVAPETWGEEGITEQYLCVKDGFHVSACKWYHPLTCAGMRCPNECQHFNDMKCTCEQAKRYAKLRAKRILRKILAAKK